MTGLEDQIFWLLPDSFSALKEKMDAFGNVRTFTILECADCDTWLRNAATLAESIDVLLLPTWEESTTAALQKSAEFLKSMAKADLLKLQHWFFRRVVALSESKFYLFALQIEFSDEQPATAGYKQFQIGNEFLYSRLKFCEYTFYASQSDVNRIAFDQSSLKV